MDEQEKKLIEEHLAKKIPKAFERLMAELENEPQLILEGEDQSAAATQTIDEITSWLFHRRQEDDGTDS